MASATQSVSRGKVMQGVIDLTFHHAAGAVLRRVLVSRGFEVEQVSLPHEGMYAQQEAGNIDIMLGWLEGSHGVYLDKVGQLRYKHCSLPNADHSSTHSAIVSEATCHVLVLYRERAVVLNRVYEPYCYWGVPEYVPESEVSEIADLAKPE
eukprot:scaffold215180_cov42-Prasinocladus_malaysianus.AAC.1